MTDDVKPYCYDPRVISDNLYADYFPPREEIKPIGFATKNLTPQLSKVMTKRIQKRYNKNRGK